MLSIAEINKIEKLVKTDFAKEFDRAPISYPKFTSEISDTESITIFEWIGALPRVREWIGARHIESMENYNYSIFNKDWELTLKIPYRKTWNKSKTKLSNMLMQKIAQMGITFRQDYPAEQVIQAVNEGTTNLAYDGFAFFDDGTNRKDFEGNAQSNLLTGTGVTLAQVKADLNTARATMRKYKDDKGRSLNLSGNLALIPADLEEIFVELTKSKLLDSSTNADYGRLDYVVDSRLNSETDWYLIDNKQFIKPFLFVDVISPELSIKDDTFDSKSIAYGADSKGNVGYSFPFLAIKIDNT